MRGRPGCLALPRRNERRVKWHACWSSHHGFTSPTPSGTLETCRLDCRCGRALYKRRRRQDVPLVTVATHRFRRVQLMTVGIDVSNPTQLTNDPDDATQGTWCPDGSKIAYAVGPRLNGKIKVMDADG